jgi:DNA-directed RNA polymerase subunit F
MSKHFEDARYYLGRAAEHAKAGIEEELEPVRERVSALIGEDAPDEPEPSRLERLQADVADLESRTEGEVRSALASARERIEAYRAGDEAEEVAEDAT